MSKYKPFTNLGPGDTIREELEHYGWEQKDLAEIMGRTEKNISQLVTNKAPITYETALLLSKTFKQSTEFWLNLDARYRERLQESAKVKETEAKALIYRYMPVRAMRNSGILPKGAKQLKESVLRFWDIEELEFDFLEERAVACFRKSAAFKNSFNPYYALTWLRHVRNLAGQMRISGKYNEEGLRELGDRLPSYTIAETGIPDFIRNLGKVGVLFVQADHFPQTYTDGASLLLDKRPVIAYTARHDRTDNFWFTMAHEIGHVLKHLHAAGDAFVDSLDHLDQEDTREREADEFAETVLRCKAILKAFHDRQRPSSAKIHSVAEDLGVHPAIVCGCLQHHGKASYKSKSFHALKEPVSHLITQS